MARPRNSVTKKRVRKTRKRPRVQPEARAAATPTLASRTQEDVELVVAKAADVVAPAADRLGRYELLFELARGGMGTVYAARMSGPHDFDRIVAVKRLRGGATDAEDRAALLDEARLGARIRHPNVVQVYELGQSDGEPFVAMELIEGRSLAQLLGRLSEDGERLSPVMAAWIIERVALGLHAAHAVRNAAGEPAELVHRDISPDNILLSFDGRVCVSDFGIARFSGDRRATDRGVIKGKFAYMSPEQTRAEPLDRRSDLFALGAVFHEVLTGKPLFDSGSAADTIRRVCEQPIDDPSDAVPEIPGELAAIAMHCLAREPADRPSSASDVAAELRAARRALQSQVDDSDLAALLGSHFPGERAALQSRLRHGQRSEATSGGDAAAAQNTVEASVIGRRPATRGRGWLWLAAGAVVLFIAAQAWFNTRPSEQPEPSALGSAVGAASSNPPASASAVAPAVSASASAAAATSAAVTASALADAPLPQQPAPAAAILPPRPRPAVPPPSSTTTTSPPSSASAPHGGVPFGTL